ncbi:MAG: aminotransferase class I/II-fold pyridoxal phosphate-dependent enzyme [Oscillospiraceae bacterium]|nr:aminotransferase class I/II-fold pyridoxal phosphate-dependent enzyme [Oscillospiraceae bacterium]
MPELSENFKKNLTGFLENYQNFHTLRLHMPGHKGKSLIRSLAGAYAWDITEIHGADSLFEANGILKSAQQETARIYQTGATFWSAGGSTLCIQAMLAQMKAEHRTILAARTVHRAFLNSCVLLDLPVTWIFPRSGSLIGGYYDLSDFEKALQQTSQPACIYVTSPDYLGNLQDIAGLSRICRKYHARLIVDNAHGAHSAFLRENQHPIANGADFCCDSAHKTLPALTGGAFLHVRNSEDAGKIQSHMQMFGSTSPSYLIMQSLESCTDWLAGQGREAIRQCEEFAEQFKNQLSEKYELIGTDPMHLTIRVNGLEFSRILRENYQIECEYADKTCLVLLLSPMLTQQDFARLSAVLLDFCPSGEFIPAQNPPELSRFAEIVCDLRTAALSDWEMIAPEQAEGRICAAVQVPCPPAVPIVLSGERITKETIAFMRFYDLDRIAVMKNIETNHQKF